MGRLAGDWRALRHGTPGRRFYDFHRARAERRGEAWGAERILTLALGVVLILGGLAIGWLPGPGGFVALIGVALLGAESLRIAKVLDRIELRARDAWHSVRRRESEPPPD